ncbi:DUF1835 domain-containing protein [Neobacillus sp. NRS-1170]|uniref:DUF1835 domain-containing protein n=1 Tax=Neobacillus sp. NRS-1170 TaxID=3233898 RepID=UPI003D2C6CE8
MDFDELKKVVKDMPERDVRSYLYHILINISFLEDKAYSLTKFSDDMKRIYEYILNPEKPVDPLEILKEENIKKVHILFGYGYLKSILKEMGFDKEEPVITFQDNFAVGPIKKLHEENGNKTRFEWTKNSFHNHEEEFEEYYEIFQRAIIQINAIPNEVPIQIWVSENAHEQTGLLFVLYLLRARTNSISIINTAKVYGDLFKKKAKKYAPFYSSGIILEDLKAIYESVQESSRYLTVDERSHFETEWLNLSEVSGTLRLWENGEIVSVSENYYDEFIIEMAKKLSGKRKKKVFFHALRLIGEVYGRIEQYVGDDFLEYRLRKLIEYGIFEYEGSLEAMRTYSIRLT